MPSTARKKLANWCAAIMLAIPAASCQTTVSSAPTEAARVACASFAPIHWSGRDTEKTVMQAKEHNAAYKALCLGAAK